MREIKFKALTREGKIIQDVGKIEFFEDGIIIVNEEIPVERLMQYTGLKDKQGIEIYEWDIISKNAYPFIDRGEPNYLGVVEWVFAGFQYILRCVNPKKQGISDGINEPLEEDEEFEIIGNIFENPELLDKK